MSGHRVDPSGAKAVAERTAAIAPVARPLRSALDDAAAALSPDEIVGPVVQAFVSARREVPQRIAARVTEAIETAAAIIALVDEGDATMAATIAAASSSGSAVFHPERFGGSR